MSEKRKWLVIIETYAAKIKQTSNTRGNSEAKHVSEKCFR